MEPLNLQTITSAAAPVVMVSAAGLLFMGLQTKNLHLADRIRTLATEYRALVGDPQHKQRLEQLRDQLVLFERRIRFSQRALESLQISMLCFVMTSMFLASTTWVRGVLITVVIAALFFGGVSLFLIALLLEFLEMRAGLKTIGIEIKGTLREGKS